MKREIKSVVAMLLATGLVAGCGMLKTSKKNQKADQITMALSGEWNSACQKQGWLGFTQLTEAYTFSALGDFEKRSAVFRHDCATPDLVVETGGTYDDLGAAVKSALYRGNFHGPARSPIRTLPHLVAPKRFFTHFTGNMPW